MVLGNGREEMLNREATSVTPLASAASLRGLAVPDQLPCRLSRLFGLFRTLLSRRLRRSLGLGFFQNPGRELMLSVVPLASQAGGFAGGALGGRLFSQQLKQHQIPAIADAMLG